MQQAWPVVSKMLILFALDIVLIIIYLAIIAPLAFSRRSAWAVMRRNFVSYFSNPTGYVFLCLFVLLTSFAAFWPHEFFANNMATLDQLNRYLPWIMLIFVPAITMSIWAEEQRQGTDELLLTLPTTDFDVVLGKYLAAATIFSASLLFSQLSNFAVLNALSLGDLDLGLFYSTYFGYWLMGLAMLAVGMVASFLTKNLTVGFILGAAFNAPFVFASSADLIVANSAVAQAISRWSMAAHLEDFGRGVISLSSITYFVAIICLGVYLCQVLIGRRHWLGGRDGPSMLGHYLVRTVSLLVLAAAAVFFFRHHDWVRLDATEGQVASLSPDTQRLLKDVKQQSDQPIIIEAFISRSIPEMYARTKIELFSYLREFQKLGGEKLVVRIHDDLEPFSDEARRAEDFYDIAPQTIRVRSRGTSREEKVILGAAFRSGRRKVVVPFFHHGVPVEYELIRSVSIVSDEVQKKLGLVVTDALLQGGRRFEGQVTGQSRTPSGEIMPVWSFPPVSIGQQEILGELVRQYDVQLVTLEEPLPPGEFDVLLVPQPSALPQRKLAHLIDAVKAGQPTAIFEDPFTFFYRYRSPSDGQPRHYVSGTSGPRPQLFRYQGRRPRSLMTGGNPYRPLERKGKLDELLDLLGIDMVTMPRRPRDRGPQRRHSAGVDWNAAVVWQDYNPHLDFRDEAITAEWIFVTPEVDPLTDGSQRPFNPDSPVTSGLREVAFVFPGAVRPQEDAQTQFTPLVRTGIETGVVDYDDVVENIDSPLGLRRVRRPLQAPGGKRIREQFILAARIEGRPEGAQAESADDAAARRDLKVIFVADLDLLANFFVSVRRRPDDVIDWRLDNIPFVLNAIDSLAGEDRFMEIRKRRLNHGRLTMIEVKSENAAQDAQEEILKHRVEFDREIQRQEKRLEELGRKLSTELVKLEQQGRTGSSEYQDLQSEARFQVQYARQQIRRQKERLDRQLKLNLEKTERRREQEVLAVQNYYKFWAVALPPIPPLLIALLVFVHRRRKESEGIAAERRRNPTTPKPDA